jgi:hypothetical protein
MRPKAEMGSAPEHPTVAAVGLPEADGLLQVLRIDRPWLEVVDTPLLHSDRSGGVDPVCGARAHGSDIRIEVPAKGLPDQWMPVQARVALLKGDVLAGAVHPDPGDHLAAWEINRVVDYSRGLILERGRIDR